MKIAYQNENVTLWHGDCREVIPTLPPWVVLVTDPPYGIDHESGWDGPYKGKAIEGDATLDARDAVLAMIGDKPAAVFGTWRMPKPHGVRAVLVWNKGPASGMGDLSFPWKPSWEEIYILGQGWSGRRDEGVLTGSVLTWASKGREHPNQKPVPLVVKLLEKAPAGAVLDPFCGSGTTLIAALETGRKAIGIEIDERWVDVAIKRLERWHAQGRLDFGTANATVHLRDRSAAEGT